MTFPLRSYSPSDRFLTKKGRLDPVQKMIAKATSNAARCPNCYIEADLSQSYHTRRLEYSLKLTVLPCPLHQPDLAVAFTDPSKPTQPRGGRVGQPSLPKTKQIAQTTKRIAMVRKKARR